MNTSNGCKANITSEVQLESLPTSRGLGTESDLDGSWLMANVVFNMSELILKKINCLGL